MFITVSHFFSVLAFLDLTLAILCCILIIKLPLKYGIKFVTIPMIILVTYLLVIQGENILGRPYDIMPKGQFEFLDYRVVSRDGIKKIEIWVIQDKKSRLHIIQYNEKTEHELAKAKARKGKGARERGEFKTEEKGKGKGENEESLSIGDIPQEEILTPKDSDGASESTPDDVTKSWQNR
jgi:predicted Co/Zn/Cd cation transporter (cation efflux family)